MALSGDGFSVGRGALSLRALRAGRALAFALALVGVFVCRAPAARAAFLTQLPTARLVLPIGPSEDLPRALLTGDFSVFLWVWPDGVTANRANLFTVPGVLEIRADPDGTVFASVHGSFGDRDALVTVAPQALAQREWNLVGVAFRGPQLDVALWVQSVSRGRITGGPLGADAPPPSPRPDGPPHAIPTEPQPIVPQSYTIGPITGPVAVGAIPQEADAMLGVTGLITVRDELVRVTDFAAVWDSRSYLAPLNQRVLGGMNGDARCAWMIGQSMTTQPWNGLSQPSFIYHRAAVVGLPVTTTNVETYWRSYGWLHNVVRDVVETNDYVFASPYDAPRDGFFVRALPFPVVALPPNTYVQGEAPRARRLATGPVRLLKVMASANSRGVRSNDSSGLSSGNYAQGFTDLLHDQTAGVLNRRPEIYGNTHFGFDAALANPYQQGEFLHVYQSDFSRFWTGTDAGGSRGPGNGLLMKPGAEYAMRCKPEGLITATAPLILQNHFLRFPGSSGVFWTPNKHSAQGAFGTDAGPTQFLPLDSEAWRHTFDPSQGDRVEAPNQFSIRGNRTGAMQPGDACYIEAGPYGSISLLTSLRYDAGTDTTSMTFEQPFGSPPAPGDTLRFGPWGFFTLEYEWPGLAPDDEAVWRALRLRVDDKAGVGAVLFGLSGWRPNVAGFVFGVAGWSGNGYMNQINRAFGLAIHGWMNTFKPDVWLQMFAQQQNPPSGMSAFADFITAGRPDLELVWLGDMTHESGDYGDWHRYILDEAAGRGVPAISLLRDPRLGTQEELRVDGLRVDGDHISGRGNTRLAELWTRDLLLAATAPINGDANDDGVVDFYDLNLVLGNFGHTGAGAGGPGDVDYDGDVDFKDLNLVLGAWGQPVE